MIFELLAIGFNMVNNSVLHRFVWCIGWKRVNPINITNRGRCMLKDRNRIMFHLFHQKKIRIFICIFVIRECIIEKYN